MTRIEILNRKRDELKAKREALWAEYFAAVERGDEHAQRDRLTAIDITCEHLALLTAEHDRLVLAAAE